MPTSLFIWIALVLRPRQKSFRRLGIKQVAPPSTAHSVPLPLINKGHRVVHSEYPEENHGCVFGGNLKQRHGNQPVWVTRFMGCIPLSSTTFTLGSGSLRNCLSNLRAVSLTRAKVCKKEAASVGGL